jgi:hypothetical protein
MKTENKEIIELRSNIEKMKSEVLQHSKDNYGPYLKSQYNIPDDKYNVDDIEDYMTWTTDDEYGAIAYELGYIDATSQILNMLKK